MTAPFVSTLIVWLGFSAVPAGTPVFVGPGNAPGSVGSPDGVGVGWPVGDELGAGELVGLVLGWPVGPAVGDELGEPVGVGEAVPAAPYTSIPRMQRVPKSRSPAS
jgi:hypothetical protein